MCIHFTEAGWLCIFSNRMAIVMIIAGYRSVLQLAVLSNLKKSESFYTKIPKQLPHIA